MAKATDTKSKITEVFLKFYSKKPLDNIQVTDICVACDISRGTFYYHFADVFAICEEIEDELIQKMENDLNDTMIFSIASQMDQSNINMFIESYKASLQKYVEFRDLFYCLINGSRGKQFTNKWIISVRKKIDMNFKYINIDQKQQQWIGTFLAAGLVNMICMWIDKGCAEDPGVVSETFAKVLFKGSIVSNI